MTTLKLLLFLVFALASLLQHGAVGEICTVEGRLRLTQTQSIDLSNAGRVEICVGGVWGTIAADSLTAPWSEKNAQVACIELGFTGALNSILQQTVPTTEMAAPHIPVNVESVQCDGSEQNITLCEHRIVSGVFSHDKNVFIVCRPNNIRYSDVHPPGVQPGDIRLFGDVRNGYGAVQVYTSLHGWQGICPDSTWSSGYPSAICRDLGYRSGSVADPVFADVVPGGESPSRLLYEMSCPSGSDSVEECSFMLGGDDTSNCNSPVGLYAAVECGHVDEESIRLIGGSDSGEGIVEIAYDGRWGMVCDEGFWRSDARAVCESLGYEREQAKVMTVYPSSSILQVESNLKPIWLSDPTCSYQSRLPLCVERNDVLIGYANCTAYGIAAVDCGDPPNKLHEYRALIAVGIALPLGCLVGVVASCIVYRKHFYKKAKGCLKDCCSCLCDDCLYAVRRRRRRHRPRARRPVTTSMITTHFSEPFSEPTEDAEPTEDGESLVFDLKHIASNGKESTLEQEVSEPDDPANSRLVEAPPPSFQASFAFPTHEPTCDDLPPPYSGSEAEPHSQASLGETQLPQSSSP